MLASGQRASRLWDRVLSCKQLSYIDYNIENRLKLCHFKPELLHHCKQKFIKAVVTDLKWEARRMRGTDGVREEAPAT